MRVLLAVAALLLASTAHAASKSTALDRYVQAPDSNYKFELVRTIPGSGWTAYVLDLTSQAWLTEKEVDRPVWKHWLTIIVPAKVTGPAGLLYITSGSNNSKPPEKPDGFYSGLAADTNSVVAELRMVPNQPLTFAGETKPRTEDALIAYTWDKYLRTGDERWPARLPMTKSAVRALDAITAFCSKLDPAPVTVNRFVVAGGSKRGWTAWTTAAVDKRVIAIIPLVIDMLNVEPSFVHHYRVYGFYAPAVKDYQDMDIMNWSGTREYRKLMEIEEPYEYRDRLTMPKLMINSTGDQFFLPDSSQFYFDDLKGEKHVRYVPNTDHGLRNSDARDTLGAFYSAVLGNQPRPRYEWEIKKDGAIVVRPVDKPSAVKLWQATSLGKRDFRLETIGAAYKSEDLTPDSSGRYIARVAPPPNGWTAYFVELTYPTGSKYQLKFTSGVKVTPDTLPFPAPKHKKPE